MDLIKHALAAKSGFRNLADVESYAVECLEKTGLGHWAFVWDNARRRLGSCRYWKKEITMSRYFVMLNMERPDQIRDTVLHEIAHALAWIHHHERGHGPHWKSYCRQLGATPRASARPESITPMPFKYHLRLKDTGEVVGSYYRKPRFARHIRSVMLRGRPETRGMLELVDARPEKTGN